jgi:CubicO group peptidase (beta-lactamase class C family)
MTTCPRAPDEQATRLFLPEDYGAYYPEWFSELPGTGYYGYMWWGGRYAPGSYEFLAEGDRGQFIFVSPEHNLVIIRNGTDHGIPSEVWMRLFHEFAAKF